MAQQVEKSRLAGKQSKYPFWDWADGNVWEARRGEDFDVEPRAFLAAARAYAKKNDLRLRHKVEDQKVAVFQFLPVMNGVGQ
ncbi:MULTISPECIES: hypothetical protein [Streptomycetaceae]|uniref:Uncharacterized protein n=1 Tax=Actinacidiphila bryophytorum TaxID=1436133 RepID=A0A9W4EDN1_9ACTN|nr:hypothetical protein [Actinacidiphila bryophytorum]MBM9434427.1 hypothetical protein [Actinacidiphila bryophytorum]MBN6541901.1 hypothetical protein [Actinacidiphila bryophytorum]CAG7625954.1 conserved hypothetical protein [Actinacidiphila bryophytorum]